MPNFTVRLVDQPHVPWVDAATNDAPSRQNNDPQYLASYCRVDVSINVATVEARANVGGVEAPFDVDLGGELFTAAWSEWSGYSPPAIVQPPGRTSVMTFELTYLHVGHFCLSIRRTNGGAVLLHFDAEEAI